MADSARIKISINKLFVKLFGRGPFSAEAWEKNELRRRAEMAYEARTFQERFRCTQRVSFVPGEYEPLSLFAEVSVPADWLDMWFEHESTRSGVSEVAKRNIDGHRRWLKNRDNSSASIRLPFGLVFLLYGASYLSEVITTDEARCLCPECKGWMGIKSGNVRDKSSSPVFIKGELIVYCEMGHVIAKKPYQLHVFYG